MANKESNPIYPPNKHNYFGDFRVAHPGVESAWGKVDEAKKEAQMVNQTTNNAPYHSHSNFENKVDIFENEFAEEITFDNLRDDYENVELRDEMSFGYDKDNYDYYGSTQYNRDFLSMNTADKSFGQEEFASEVGVDLTVRSEDEGAEEGTLPFTHASIIKYKTI
ncbi:hypothetical protein [Clostridium sp.]|uniref:hypothetical protein n=1 Tax=Clostridium sp. TaxID=1506 RepID=UPI002FCA8C78